MLKDSAAFADLLFAMEVVVHINYRQYTMREMIEILSQESIYFSRRNSALQQSDVIKLDIKTDGQFSGGIISISCEIYNNCEGIRGILARKNFLQTEAQDKYYKCWTIPFKYTQDSRKLLDDIAVGLDEAFNSAPLYLYASPAQKALEGYRCFMRSNLPKVRYYDIMKYLGYSYEECMPDEVNFNAELDYMIARYRNGCWGAWISGDLIVPLFSSEHEAVEFLKKRAKYITYVNSVVTVKTISPIRESRSSRMYVLVDSAASRKEKIAWLQSEIERLQGAYTGYLRGNEQRGKAVSNAAN